MKRRELVGIGIVLILASFFGSYSLKENSLERDELKLPKIPTTKNDRNTIKISKVPTFIRKPPPDRTNEEKTKETKPDKQIIKPKRQVDTKPDINLRGHFRVLGQISSDEPNSKSMIILQNTQTGRSKTVRVGNAAWDVTIVSSSDTSIIIEKKGVRETLRVE